MPSASRRCDVCECELAQQALATAAAWSDNNICFAENEQTDKQASKGRNEGGFTFRRGLLFPLPLHLPLYASLSQAGM